MNSTVSPTVLVVEDDADTRAAVAELLEDEGFHAVVANNGREALAYLRDHVAPACIVLDLWMPSLDGWSFVSDLRARRMSKIPIVVITAADPHWGYPIPDKWVLRKPVDMKRLASVITTLTTTSPDPLSS